MEIKTLEEFFIAKYEDLESDDAELRCQLKKRMEDIQTLQKEAEVLREEIGKAKSFISEYLSVEFESYGHKGERKLSLSDRVSEWYAMSEEEKAKATKAIEYALSMGAKDKTKVVKKDKDK